MLSSGRPRVARGLVRCGGEGAASENVVEAEPLQVESAAGSYCVHVTVAG